MKSLILFVACSFSVVASATTWNFDCGRSMNVRQSLIVKDAKVPTPNDYSLEATLIIRGRDKITGVLTAKTYKMEGQTDSVTNFSEQPQSAIALLEIGNPARQFVIQNVKVGQFAKAQLIELKSRDEADIQDLQCKLISKK